jgi:hypothetical protein
VIAADAVVTGFTPVIRASVIPVVATIIAARTVICRAVVVPIVTAGAAALVTDHYLRLAATGVAHLLGPIALADCDATLDRLPSTLADADSLRDLFPAPFADENPLGAAIPVAAFQKHTYFTRHPTATMIAIRLAAHFIPIRNPDTAFAGFIDRFTPDAFAAGFVHRLDPDPFASRLIDRLHPHPLHARPRAVDADVEIEEIGFGGRAI